MKNSFKKCGKKCVLHYSPSSIGCTQIITEVQESTTKMSTLKIYADM